MPYRDLPEITAKQKEIVDLAYKFRFINRHQIQKLFGHKDPRRVNTWLKDLFEKKYLGRIYSHKLLENTKPAIYYLANNGILWVRFKKGEDYKAENEKLDFRLVKKFYEDKHASETFRNHCTTICEFYTQIREKEKASKKKFGYEFATKTEIRMYNQLRKDFDEKGDLIPDVYLEKFNNQDSKNEESIAFFLELFDVHVPRYALRYKVSQYIKFSEGGKWNSYAGSDGKFPTVLLVLANQQKINHLKKYIKKELEGSYDPPGIRFVLTTYKRAVEEGIGTDIWQEVE